MIRHEEQKKAQAKANEEEKENLEREMNGITVRVKPTIVVIRKNTAPCALKTLSSAEICFQQTNLVKSCPLPALAAHPHCGGHDANGNAAKPA